MKPMGTPPPRNPEADQIKRQIWAEQYNQRNKAAMPEAVLNDQFGAEPPPRIDDGPTCYQCGDHLVYPHIVFDGKTGHFWCEDCVRQLYSDLCAATQAEEDGPHLCPERK